MARPKSNGSYAPLSATYFRDDAILEAGPDAELLFVRVLAFLSDASSDGFITDRQVRYAVGYGLRNVQKRITKLQEVGLLEAVAGGFTPRSWHKWNKTAEEIGKNLKRDRERKALKAGEVSPNSIRNGTGNDADSACQSTTKQVNTKQSNKSVVAIRADVESLCNLLADLIEANGSLRPDIGKSWLDAARLLIDNDKRDPATSARLIRWTQADPFWRGNVLSMPTFRKRFDQLRLAANAQLESRKKGPRTTAAEKNLSTVEYFAQEAQKELGS
jgi:hypothetical protein